jgi:hypothetical protein
MPCDASVIIPHESFLQESSFQLVGAFSTGLPTHYYGRRPSNDESAQ